MCMWSVCGGGKSLSPLVFQRRSVTLIHEQADNNMQSEFQTFLDLEKKKKKTAFFSFLFYFLRRENSNLSMLTPNFQIGLQ